jgi:hypothetical protein
VPQQPTMYPSAVLEDGLVSEIGSRLRKLGFKKKRLTWRRETDHGIEIVNIQRSQFGASLFLNVGVYVGGEPEPQIGQCLHYRIEHEGRDAGDVFADITARFDKERVSRGAWLAAPPVEAKRIRVRHPKLGNGTVIAEQDDSVRVAFDDGTTRLLKRSFLEFSDATLEA